MNSFTQVSVVDAEELATKTLDWINKTRQAKLDAAIAREMSADRRNLWAIIMGKPTVHYTKEEALEIIKSRDGSWDMASEYDEIMIEFGLTEEIAKNILKMSRVSADGTIQMTGDELDRITQ